MAVSLKRLLRGSWLRRGLKSIRDDAAQERVSITGLDGLSTDYDTALDQLKSASSGGFPHYARLKPHAITAWRPEGSQRTHMMGQIDYRRVREIVDKRQSAFNLGRVRGGYWPYRSFHDSPNEFDIEQPPIEYMVQQPVLFITIPTELSYNPLGYITTFQDTLNDASVTWLATGMTFAAKQLLFPADGLQVDPVYVEGDGLRYFCQYTFVYRKDTWFEWSRTWVADDQWYWNRDPDDKNDMFTTATWVKNETGSATSGQFGFHEVES